MLSKPLIQFSVDGWACVLSLLFDLRPTSGGGNEDNGNLFQRSLAPTAALNAPSPAASHCQPTPPPETPDIHRQVWSNLLWVTAPFSWILVCTRFCLCPPRVCFPVLCKFWRLYGGVNGSLLQEGLFHTHICCPQSPSPCGRPLLTCTCTGDTQTLNGRSDSVSVGSPVSHKVLFELSVSGRYWV